MMAMALESLSRPTGQLVGALFFTLLWCAVLERISGPIGRRVKAAAWWPQALPNQISLMANFGYPKGETTEAMAIFGYTWICTMCLTHIVSAGLMLPVVVRGWDGAGETGQLCFFLGTLSEVGFDIYDFTRTFLTTFLHERFPSLGPRTPVKSFVLLCVFHHVAVLFVTVPTNLSYASMTAYHQGVFSLLASAAVCFAAGQYKLTLDTKTPAGLATVKKIMTLQFAMNWLARVFVWFPAVVSALSTFHAAQDTCFFWGACIAATMMSLYNVLVVLDATAALLKWLPRSAAAGAQGAKVE